MSQQRQDDEVVFNNIITPLNGIREFTSVLLVNLGIAKITTANRYTAFGSPVIDTFSGGYDGQTIKILGNGTATIDNTSSIKTNTGASKVLGAGKVYTFTNFSGVWYEDE